MLIGELAKRSGYSRDTIRYYEKLGLVALGAEQKSGNGYKHYTPKIARRLEQIRCLKDAGFTLHEIREILLNNGQYHVCHSLPERLADKLSKIDGQVAALLKFKASLLQIQGACGGACATHDGMPDCVPLPGNKKTCC